MRTVVGASIVGTALVLASSIVQPVLAQREPGLSSSDPCPTENLAADVTPADAQGTTFVGTYEGDTISGITDGQRDLLTRWSVERVYAGGPIPADLIFGTPGCRWTNLTPGVRYLFSTAATDLHFSTEGAGVPTVTDSMAWELLDDGDVRLAPFDTYDAADYTSEAVSAVRTFDEALAAVAPGAGEGEPPGPLEKDDFGCLASWFSPRTPADASGTAFVGTYIGDEQLPVGRGIADHRVYWSVERVYAGDPLPEVLTLRTDGCLPVTLKPGKRYLFTTADLTWPSVSNSYAWRLRKGDRIRLTPFGTLDREGTPKEARILKTLAAALAAVAPDADEGETPERAADRTPG